MNIRTRDLRQQPSELMLQWLENEPDREWTPILDALMAGTHANNSYHNSVHMLNVAWSARHCYRTEVRPDDYKYAHEVIVVASALLHDFDHSGGYHAEDRFNVSDSIDFIRSAAGINILDAAGFDSEDIEIIVTNINTTTFNAANKTFPIQPTNTMQKALRDADVMSLYSLEGRYLICGLFAELYGKSLAYASKDEAIQYARNTYSFLSSVRMYTLHGNRLQAQQLTKCMRDLLSIMASYNTELLHCKVTDVVPEVAVEMPDNFHEDLMASATPIKPTLQ